MRPIASPYRDPFFAAHARHGVARPPLRRATRACCADCHGHEQRSRASHSSTLKAARCLTIWFALATGAVALISMGYPITSLGAVALVSSGAGAWASRGLSRALRTYAVTNARADAADAADRASATLALLGASRGPCAECGPRARRATLGAARAALVWCVAFTCVLGSLAGLLVLLWVVVVFAGGIAHA
jgi:hypothetical protein